MIGPRPARRLALGRLADVTVIGADALPAAPALVVADHPGAVDADVLTAWWPRPLTRLRSGVPVVAALRLGRSVLVFPEAGVSPDGSLGRFRPEAFEDALHAWSLGWRGPVVPVAISGTYGLRPAGSLLASPAERARVVVRVGTPILGFDGLATELADVARGAVARLRAEQAGTWLGVAGGQPLPPGAGPSWRTAWANGEQRVEPGATAPRRIWR